MDLDALPAALEAAGGRVRDLAAELPTRAAEAILAATRPPRRTGALAATGRVEDGSVVFGGGVVDYAAPVHALNPFLDAAQLAADDAVAELGEAALDAAVTL